MLFRGVAKVHVFGQGTVAKFDEATANTIISRENLWLKG